MNNDMRNYRWTYRYEESPTLTDVSNIMAKTKNIEELFKYADDNSNDMYLDFESFQEYRDEYRNNVIFDIIRKGMNYKTKKTKKNQRFIIEEDYETVKKKYITYENVRFLFNCNGKMYFNKCLELIEPQKIEKKYLKKVDTNLLGGER
jgi:hypothetical protein